LRENPSVTRPSVADMPDLSAKVQKSQFGANRIGGLRTPIKAGKTTRDGFSLRTDLIRSPPMRFAPNCDFLRKLICQILIKAPLTHKGPLRASIEGEPKRDTTVCRRASDPNQSWQDNQGWVQLTDRSHPILRGDLSMSRQPRIWDWGPKPADAVCPKL
jgi:hypothetical protein